MKERFELIGKRTEDYCIVVLTGESGDYTVSLGKRGKEFEEIGTGSVVLRNCKGKAVAVISDGFIAGPFTIYKDLEDRRIVVQIDE